MNGSGQASGTGVAVLTVVVVVAVLKLAQEVFIPLALAILLTFLLAPMVERLHRWRINRALAVIVSMVFALALIGGLGDVVFNQFSDLAHEFPTYQRQLRINLTHVGGALRGEMAVTTKAVEQLTKEIDRVAPTVPSPRGVSKVQVVEQTPTSLETVRSVVAPLIKPVGTTLAVIVLVAFMLLRLPDLRERIMWLLGSRNLHVTIEALNDAAGRVSRYLRMQIVINGWTGLWVAVGLWFLHVPHAGLWGALTLVLRFIPYVGAWMAAAMPLALSFAVSDDLTRPMLVLGLFLVLEFFSFSVLEPWLYGSHTGVSPVALLLAAAFWAWLWGLAGLFLAIPITVCAVVMGKYIPQLAFLEVLLGDEPVLRTHERLYHRLLSSSRDEADTLLQAALSLKSLREVCDSIIVPAMLLTEENHERGTLTDEKRRTILEHLSEWVDERVESTETSRSHSDLRVAPNSSAAFLCVPASDRADEIIAKLLKVVMLDRGLNAHVVSESDAVQRAGIEGATTAIIVSSLPPEAVTPARAICKFVRAGNDSVPVLVGLWNANGDLERARQRLESVSGTRVITSFAECFALLEQTASATDSPASRGSSSSNAPWPAEPLNGPDAAPVTPTVSTGQAPS